MSASSVRSRASNSGRSLFLSSRFESSPRLLSFAKSSEHTSFRIHCLYTGTDNAAGLSRVSVTASEVTHGGKRCSMLL